MSNLGWYQIMTTIAKKVGGPRNLALLIAGGGAIVGGSAVAGVNVVKKKVTNAFLEKKKAADLAQIYTVKTEGTSNEGLLFKVNDKFRVLEQDGDAVLIEKIKDEHNPYFVSAKFISSISDYCMAL